MTKHPTLMKIMRLIGTVLFLAFSVGIYLAFFEGLQSEFSQYLNRMWIIMILCVTYMFRIDVLAAAGAYVGLRFSLHWPDWSAIAICSVFVVISIYVNHGASTRMKYFFGRVNRKEIPVDAVAERVAPEDR